MGGGSLAGFTGDTKTFSNISDGVQVQSFFDLGQIPTKTGYTFAAWKWLVGETPGATVVAHDVVLTNKNFRATYTPVTYDITYTLYSGTNDAGNPDTYDIETATITLGDATKDYYDFGGWFEEDTFVTEVTEIALGSHGDVDLYAKFTPTEYDITYVLDGGTNGANPATYNVETATITLADATKAAHNFNGWFTDAGLTQAITTIPLGSHGDLTIYAKFTAI